jgi:hypothetical protein
VALFSEGGDLDPSFADGGTATPDLREPLIAVPAPDGRFAILGYAMGPVSNQVVTERFDGDGSPDMAYGDRGLARVPRLEQFGEVAAGVPADAAIGGGGELFISMDYPTPLASLFQVVFALGATGALDSSFGTGGHTLPNRLPEVSASGSVATTSDGSIILGIEEGPARFTPAGVLDEEFSANVDGAFPLGVFGLEAEPEGQIITSSTTAVSDDREPADCNAPQGTSCSHSALETKVLLADGAADVRFGDDGVATTSLDERYWNDALQPGPLRAAPAGRLTVVSVPCGKDGRCDLVVVRLGF